MPNLLVSVNKYCLENNIDLTSLINLMKSMESPIYKIGSTYFVDSMESIARALVVDLERRVVKRTQRSAKAKVRAERVRAERDFIRELEARGFSLDNIQAVQSELSKLPIETISAKEETASGEKMSAERPVRPDTKSEGKVDGKTLEGGQ